MLGPGGCNGNNIFMEENRFRCENIPGTRNHVVNGQFLVHDIAPMNRAGVGDAFCLQQKLHMPLNSSLWPTESVGIGSALDVNRTSTGLKLSPEEDEQNSTVTPGENTWNPLALSLETVVKLEIDRSSEELSQFIKLKEQNMLKGIREISQRHAVPLLSALEKNINQKLHEKNLAIENMNQKNKVLGDRIKKVAMEAQSWRSKATYYESVAIALESNIQYLRAQGIEGNGEKDDAVSCSNDPQISGTQPQLTCRACGVREVSFLIMPCRHLCLCFDCDRFIDICPVCQSMKTAGVHVYL